MQTFAKSERLATNSLTVSGKVLQSITQRRLVCGDRSIDRISLCWRSSFHFKVEKYLLMPFDVFLCGNSRWLGAGSQRDELTDGSLMIHERGIDWVCVISFHLQYAYELCSGCRASARLNGSNTLNNKQKYSSLATDFTLEHLLWRQIQEKKKRKKCGETATGVARTYDIYLDNLFRAVFRSKTELIVFSVLIGF